MFYNRRNINRKGVVNLKNPVVDGWYADPESRVYGDTVYLYVTRSLPFREQKNLDLVVTSDLENFEIVRDILDMSTFCGAEFAIWAPTVIDKDGKYYLIFAANDIHHDHEPGGLYIGVCDSPRGPFRNVFPDGRPLLNVFYNGAQPIDAHLYKDDDGEIYLYYGGWRHLIVCRMNDTMDGFAPMEAPCIDGVAREITPDEYVEAPYVMKLDGRYTLMYSTGKWTNGTYRVKAAAADAPCDEFRCYGDVLQANGLYDGPGHNSAFTFRGKHYTAYHRRTKGDTNDHHRKLCIDALPMENGRLGSVTMT